MLSPLSEFLQHLDTIGVHDRVERQNLVNFVYPEMRIENPPPIRYYYTTPQYTTLITNLLNDLYYQIIEEDDNREYEDEKVPLTEDGAKKLKIELFDPVKHNKCELCSICQSNFEIGKEITILPCDHYFHKECTDPWFKSYHHICPLCRKDVND
jgi:hypothetical protein